LERASFLKVLTLELPKTQLKYFEAPKASIYCG
jgi:hypothetical protein